MSIKKHWLLLRAGELSLQPWKPTSRLVSWSRQSNPWITLLWEGSCESKQETWKSKSSWEPETWSISERPRPHRPQTPALSQTVLCVCTYFLPQTFPGWGRSISAFGTEISWARWKKLVISHVYPSSAPRRLWISTFSLLTKVLTL